MRDRPEFRRRDDVDRSRTVPIKKMTKEQMRLGRLLYPDTKHDRPHTRADCSDAERPCPFVSCKHHLYLDVNPETGSIKLNFPGLNPWELTETCALDIASRGGVVLGDVGRVMNLTRERIRQLEMMAMENMLEGLAVEGTLSYPPDEIRECVGVNAEVA